MANDSTSSTREFFRAVQELDAHRPFVDRAQVFAASALALENSGHVRLAEAAGSPASSAHLGGLFVVVLFWGLGTSAGVALQVSLLASSAIAVGLAIVYGIAAATLPRAAGPFAALLIAVWMGAAGALAATVPDALLWTHGIPIVGALGLAVALRTLRLREARDVALALAGTGRSVPYLVPVVLVAVLLPALTEDIWQLSASAGPLRVLGALVLSVGVLLVLVARQLRRELRPALITRCRTLAGETATPEQSRAAIEASVDDETAKIIHEIPAETLVDAWPLSSEEYAPYLAEAEGDALRRPLVARLIVTVAVVGLLLAGYIYALLGVTVPGSVAAAWTGSAIEPFKVSLVGITVGLPGGTYVAVAFLLGIFATAIFLAFALTEERISAAVTEALLREPIDRFLLLAVPFISSTEWAFENQETLQSLGAHETELSGDAEESTSEEVSR